MGIWLRFSTANPTKMCAYCDYSVQHVLSDYKVHWVHEEAGSFNSYGGVHNEDADQTASMCMLVLIFTGQTCHIVSFARPWFMFIPKILMRPILILSFCFLQVKNLINVRSVRSLTVRVTIYSDTKEHTQVKATIYEEVKFDFLSIIG